VAIDRRGTAARRSRRRLRADTLADDLATLLDHLDLLGSGGFLASAIGLRRADTDTVSRPRSGLLRQGGFLGPSGPVFFSFFFFYFFLFFFFFFFFFFNSSFLSCSPRLADAAYTAALAELFRRPPAGSPTQGPTSGLPGRGVSAALTDEAIATGVRTPLEC